MAQIGSDGLPIPSYYNAEPVSLTDLFTNFLGSLASSEPPVDLFNYISDITQAKYSVYVTDEKYAAFDPARLIAHIQSLTTPPASAGLRLSMVTPRLCKIRNIVQVGYF